MDSEKTIELNQKNREADQPVNYLEIKPRNIPLRELGKIRPKYKIDNTLVMLKDAATHHGDLSKPSLTLAGYSRNPELERLEIEDPITHEKIKPSEIADYNFQEMERATALKWYLALSRLLTDKNFNIVPVHSPDKRVKIAIPGCHLGFEIGGILDFFNEQGIAVDVEAVDIYQAGAERKFMKLDLRCQKTGSKVNFYSQTDAKEFFKDKKTDILILRHPGPVFEPDQYYIWKQIIQEIAKNKPGIIILSTYNHRLDDEYFIEKVVGKKGQKEIFESEVIEEWLKELGYKRDPDEPEAWVMDDSLEYPLSPYMLAYGSKEPGQIQWTVSVDREITIYGSENYKTANNLKNVN